MEEFRGAVLVQPDSNSTIKHNLILNVLHKDPEQSFVPDLHPWEKLLTLAKGWVLFIYLFPVNSLIYLIIYLIVIFYFFIFYFIALFILFILFYCSHLI